MRLNGRRSQDSAILKTVKVKVKKMGHLHPPKWYIICCTVWLQFYSCDYVA